MQGVAAVEATQSYEDQGVNNVDALHIQKRYGEERAKRLRDEGIGQFVELSLDSRFEHLQKDPWVQPGDVKDVSAMFPDRQCRLLIIGAGLGGLMYAVRMVEAGIRPKDIRVIDTAGGWGGTWYWNRYPGLMCDIESYMYLPLLEETGYMPKHRYSYGEEIREYANLVAAKWGMKDSAVFQTRAKKLHWDGAAKQWTIHLKQKREGESPVELHVHANAVALVNGVLNWSKVPNIPGILDYKGTTFHTQRWNYDFTGGSPSDSMLTKLEDKTVVVVGTGCTAVQVVPALAPWVKHLYVVQRTPSSVDRRDQRQTDPDWFRTHVANAPGWQRERLRNFHQHFTTGEQPATNLVDDQWTRAVGMVAIAGNKLGPTNMEALPSYMELLHALDMERQGQVRARTLKEVHDPDTAMRLQPWYPTWCKRPAFHDDYLAAFNRSNVTLLDTEGKDPEGITEDSIIVDGKSYPVDAIIFATGFRAPFTGSPAQKANMEIIGRNGISMNEEWAKNGPSTLHGVLDTNFPNLFLSGPWQASTSPNFLFNDDSLAKHCAYILTQAERRANGKPFVVVSTPAAVQDWAMQVLVHAAPMAALAGCIPGYFNVEGMLDKAPPEMQMQMARSGLWGHGIEDFLSHIEAWRKEGNLNGIEVET